MRIYTHINKHKISETHLEKYYSHTTQLYYLWPNGTSAAAQACPLLLENDGIYFTDKIKRDVKKTLIGAYPVTLSDDEYIKTDKLCYQIPPYCQSEILHLKSYKLKPESLLEWVMVYQYTAQKSKTAVVKEHYFYIPPDHDIHEPEIKAEFLQWGVLTPLRFNAS